jgi:hypothetical protein
MIARAVVAVRRPISSAKTGVQAAIKERKPRIFLGSQKIAVTRPG